MAQQKISDGSILIAHLADIHLRDTQYVTPRRGLDFFEAAKQAVSKACKKADLLVIVGDIFDRSRPSPNVIGQLMQIDRMLQEAGKAMLAVTGNHDWSDPTWLGTLFPGRTPKTGRLPDDAVGIIPIDGATVTFRGFTFAGIKPYGCSAFRHNLAEVTVAARDADVVLYHALVDGVVPFYAGQDPLRVDELPISMNNKAWLLGDIHVQGMVMRDRPGGGKTLVSYPGSTEMCSASEDTRKSVPLIRLSKDAAVGETPIPLTIRPFINAEVTTEEELEVLMRQVSTVAAEDPVVIAKFSRDLPQTINRLHSMLDAQRAVIRCYPLPTVKAAARRAKDDRPDAPLSMDYFVAKRFEGRPDLEAVALDLLHRGDSDASGIISLLIENRLAATAVRELDGE
jgi:DNA repair exonuclease SbcCD nuclease subunit